ncbi:hypothetical protein TZ94_01155 [Streptococcus infantis]|uniref:Uncharacterized protein n=1 Tax=Streptococcus infantis TaxID=68892 RepID=A0A0F2DZF6_9STRE|nr:hypothetical protein [Streptococcus infantis]KJQ75390.1 hypothetical protein TZ94_01155 [Streptococcus infantis]
MNSSLIMIFFFFEIIVIAGIILDAISNSEKIDYSNSLSSLVFMACNIGVFVLFNPSIDDPYLEVILRIFYLLTHIPLSLTYAITTLYKSIKHIKYFPSKFDRILICNVTIIFLLSIVNVFVFFRETKEIYILIFLQGLFSGIQFLLWILERKRVQKLLKQRNEDPVIQNLETTEDEPHED